MRTTTTTSYSNKEDELNTILYTDKSNEPSMLQTWHQSQTRPQGLKYSKIPLAFNFQYFFFVQVHYEQKKGFDP